MPEATIQPTGEATNGSSPAAAEPAACRVAIAIEDPLARTAILEVLDEEADLAIAGIATSGEEAVASASAEHPDVVVLYLLELTPEVVHRIADAAPAARILVLAPGLEELGQLEMVEAGAAGVLVGRLRPGVMARVVRAMHAGEAAVPRSLTGLLASRYRDVERGFPGMRPVHSDLTAREWEILDLLANDRSTRAIGERLGLAPATVYSHVKRIFRKLGVHSRAEAVTAAARLRSVSPAG